jgi:GH15 family glucan-1,4-alpha-glucosidase
LRDLKKKWRRRDQGIWEVRGGKQQFTHSKLMAWVAYDRAIKGVEEFGLSGPLDDWKAMRGAIAAEIVEHGWSERRRSFVQTFDGEALDASLLLIPLVGFLPPDDPRVIATVEAIQRELVRDGLVLRYLAEETDDGVGGEEGTFLVCSFWLADALTMVKRYDEAMELFERLLALRNDVGLLAEEYDPRAGRQHGNFPQAFSHVGIVNTAKNLISVAGPSEMRADRAPAKETEG